MKENLFTRQLGDYFDIFLPEVKKAAKNTIASYGDAFAIFFEFADDKLNLPHHRITYKHLTDAMFDEFLLWMKNERGYSPSSIRGRIYSITAFLRYASRRNVNALGAYSTARAVELPKNIQKGFPYFTQDEIKILFTLPDTSKYLGIRDFVILPFLYDTAARAGEVCNTLVGDIRFGSPTRVKLRHGKGNKSREIAISDEVAELLRYYLKSENLNTSESREKPLFSSQTNDAMTPSCIRSIVEKYVDIAKVKNKKMFTEKSYSPHSFRHSKAVHMAEVGVNLIYIRNFLGHASISSTEIYARIGNEAVTKALTDRRIPRLAPENPPKPSKTKAPLPEFITKARKNM